MRQKYCWGLRDIRVLLMCGVLPVYLAKWRTRSHSFTATRKLTSCLEFSGEEQSILLVSIIIVGCCRILGTPTNATWPGIHDLPDYKPNFPRWSGRPLKDICPNLDSDGCNLLQASQHTLTSTRCVVKKH